jgi:hypothetical protein
VVALVAVVRMVPTHRRVASLSLIHTPFCSVSASVRVSPSAFQAADSSISTVDPVQ